MQDLRSLNRTEGAALARLHDIANELLFVSGKLNRHSPHPAESTKKTSDWLLRISNFQHQLVEILANPEEHDFTEVCLIPASPEVSEASQSPEETQDA